MSDVFLIIVLKYSIYRSTFLPLLFAALGWSNSCAAHQQLPPFRGDGRATINVKSTCTSARLSSQYSHLQGGYMLAVLPLLQHKCVMAYNSLFWLLPRFNQRCI